MQKVVATGEWLYDGTVPTVVRVVQLDYDFWYAIGEADAREAGGDVEPDQSALNPEGFLYYVRHKPGWSEGQQFWPDSPGFSTVDEAKAAAQAGVPTPIAWR